MNSTTHLCDSTVTRNLGRPLRVLFVVDTVYWVTATIARRIWHFNRWIEPGLISSEGVEHLLSKGGGHLPIRTDVVHFMTPHIATRYRDQFWKQSACVATIHHVEDAASIEPAVNSDAVMTVCHQWHDELLLCGVPPENCVMLRNAVDSELFRPPSFYEAKKARAKFGIPLDSFCVGFSGKETSNTKGRKGIDVFIAAAEEFSKFHTGVVFVVMGPGWAKVASEFRKRGINLIYLPFLIDQDEVASFYRMLDVYWVTSRIEGGPVPLLEAMSSGVPCVATPVGAALEAIDDQKNGFIVPFDSIGSFVNVTSMLKQDAIKAKTVGDLARATIRVNFKQADVVSSACNLYSRAIDNFLGRGGSFEARCNGPSWKNGVIRDLPTSLQNSLAAREEFSFMNTLISAGSQAAARKIALRGLLKDPFTVATWLEIALIYPATDRFIRFARWLSLRIKR